MALKKWQFFGQDATPAIVTVQCLATLNLVKTMRISRVLVQGVRFDGVGGIFPEAGYINLQYSAVDRPPYSQPQEVVYTTPTPPAVINSATFIFPKINQNWIDVDLIFPGGNFIDLDSFVNLDVPLVAGDTALVYTTIEYEWLDE